MARRKEPVIPDAVLDQLLAGADPKTAFDPNGLLDGLKKAVDGHFLFVCKPASHPTIEEYLTGIELPALTRRVKRGRGDAGAITVNWLMIEIADATDKATYRNSFITDLPVGPDTVAELAECSRARWKVENEAFNVLKTNGYNLEHNFGHGKKNLSAVFVTLNLLAFAFHTVCDLIEEIWQLAMKKMARAPVSSRTCGQ